LITQNIYFHMSNITRVPMRLLRWLLACLVIGVGLFALAGRWQDPWLWAYVVIFAASGLYPAVSLTDDLARERFHPPEPGADRLSLRAIRLIALVHLVIGALDGRWQISHVPDALRLVSLAGMAFSFGLVFRAMMTNQFFSAVVRIQRERGHRVVDQGVYAVVRHPGYAGMILAMPFSGLVLGSWLAFTVAVLYSVLTLRRALFEDAYLRANLEGYEEYATRVRHRLIPGIW